MSRGSRDGSRTLAVSQSNAPLAAARREPRPPGPEHQTVKRGGAGRWGPAPRRLIRHRPPPYPTFDGYIGRCGPVGPTPADAGCGIGCEPPDTPLATVDTSARGWAES